MKTFWISLGFFFFQWAVAQNATVNYQASSDIIANPERGFFKFTETHSNAYTALNTTTLTNYRVNQKISLIYRVFYLENFINSPISSTYLAQMQLDFDKVRAAGLKCIIRFAYSNNEDAAQRDASKAMMLTHIQQIAPLLQANEDVISVMQAGFIGLWGEWYYTSQAEFGGWGYNQTDLTPTNNNHRKDILNAILNALPASRMVQIRYPAFKQQMYSNTALTTLQGFSQTNAARIGHHNDCFLASTTDYGTYENPTTQYPYLEQETKFVPMGGETCAVNLPRSGCATAIAELAKFHWSFMNVDYFPGVISGFESDNCFVDMEKKLGYRFEMRSSTLPQNAVLGATLPVTLRLINSGYASPYNARTVALILKNNTTQQFFPLPMNTDPRRWLGTSEIVVSENIPLPSSLPVGNYSVYLHVADASSSLASRPEYAIRMANQNMWDATTGFNNLNFNINVTAPLALADIANPQAVIYPVPAQDLLTIQLTHIETYTIALYNALGQKITTNKTQQSDKLILDVKGLSNGIYFIDIEKDGIKDTRPIVLGDD
ncbi:DUF4832 domain-containing protein [Flavobacterium sp.]|uniref:T9SS type A sorting domain-containing protein n=1 Tax=Flavobacterium sp. TaxID=239 RepID=UPI00260AD97B|nr:DUF4832 domain-containing protein [Flavobacterium sp.]